MPNIFFVVVIDGSLFWTNKLLEDKRLAKLRNYYLKKKIKIINY